MIIQIGSDEILDKLRALEIQLERLNIVVSNMSDAIAKLREETPIEDFKPVPPRVIPWEQTKAVLEKAYEVE
jgi:hypothetical protein